MGDERGFTERRSIEGRWGRYIYQEKSGMQLEHVTMSYGWEDVGKEPLLEWILRMIKAGWRGL